jgi:hypothetical protein
MYLLETPPATYKCSPRFLSWGAYPLFATHPMGVDPRTFIHFPDGGPTPVRIYENPERVHPVEKSWEIENRIPPAQIISTPLCSGDLLCGTEEGSSFEKRRLSLSLNPDFCVVIILQWCFVSVTLGCSSMKGNTSLTTTKRRTKVH